MTRKDVHSPAWTGFTYLSFCVAAGMTALGLIYLPMGIWERGYMAMASVFLVHASVSLTKTLRDRYEAESGGTGR